MSDNKQWTTDRPGTIGKYRMRDKVFGWGPINVAIIREGGVLKVVVDGNIVPVDLVGRWVEWREVGE